MLARMPVEALMGDRPTLTHDAFLYGADARHLVRRLAVEHGWDGTDRLDELLLVTSEIVANAVLYGGERRELRVWVSPAALVCEVGDDGPGPADPLAGYRPPDETTLGGRGMWIARQLCEAFAVSHHDGWTRVRYVLPHPAASPA
ncbi:ATP-binding protein [Dactylosporangium sp. NBC_01737]|uniref:ATP-binding protein n=1 Tax=Dactylosporangium sp. NBC_01737 TaxID=2975959 RepID=UPI002E0DFA62|nr:ATP-binding protein [Dactylosporangium sp. NBC_01737]